MRWLAALLLLFAVAAQASERFRLCSPWETTAPEEPSFHDQNIRFFADHALIDREGVSVLTGDVDVYHEGRRLSAQQVHYHERSGLIEVEQGVSLSDASLQLDAQRGQLWLETEVARFDAVRYRYAPAHARGGAASLERQTPQRIVLHDSSYTTCDAGYDDWRLSARRVVLKQDQGQGTARDVWLHFYEIPIFYTPWISFPLDDQRKSGVLAPRIGNAQATGLDIEIPYYFNLAPQYDATLGVRMMSRRGVMLDTELRYLTASQRGMISADYLPDDQRYAENRSLLSWQHSARPLPRLAFDVDVSDVSDKDYFNHFGASLAVSSTTHLERRADIRYSGDYFTALGRVQGYQTLDPTIAPEQRPYQRLPQWVLEGDIPGWGGLEYGVRAEWVAFSRTDSMTGQRLDLSPRLRWAAHGPAWFFQPMFKYRTTHYQLADAPETLETQQQRHLPVFSVDSGLFFERPLPAQRVQTLEPRLYYLYVPYRDQDHLPVFDTAPLAFGFEQLFREERFTGPDRIGDANQFTAALTTRVLDPAWGGEWLHASLGQIIYLNDRRVGLDPDSSVQTAQHSSLVGELGWRPRLQPLGQHDQNAGVQLRLALQADPEEKNLEHAVTQFQYRADAQRVLNLSYRFRENRQQQTDLSFAWPLSERIDMVGRWNYSLRDQRDLESFAGLEYSTCCWAVRVVGRRHLTYGGEGDYNSGIYAQLVLQGLTSMGTGIGELLEEGILGYATRD